MPIFYLSFRLQQFSEELELQLSNPRQIPAVYERLEFEKAEDLQA